MSSTLSTYHPARKFRPTYEALLMRLLKTDYEELNERTGHSIRTLDPVSFTLDLSSGELPVCGVRKTWPKSAAAEVAWFLMAQQDVTWIAKYAPLWNDFVEADGRTVEGAYGYRWRELFGRDQIGDAVKALDLDPSNRRVVVMAWDASRDGLLTVGQKNVPCPLGFTLSIRGGRLNSSLFIRSSDVFVGLPYDVMGHALLMDAIAAELKARDCNIHGLGTMHVTLAHPHLYEVHRQQAWEALNSASSDDTILMPGRTISQICYRPDAYVEEVRARQSDVRQPAYGCKPEIVK